MINIVIHNVTTIFYHYNDVTYYRIWNHCLAHQFPSSHLPFPERSGAVGPSWLRGPRESLPALGPTLWPPCACSPTAFALSSSILQFINLFLTESSLLFPLTFKWYIFNFYTFLLDSFKINSFCCMDVISFYPSEDIFNIYFKIRFYLLY